jgi:5-methylthioadenosine/S-adenosylhomocysteine deaminase
MKIKNALVITMDMKRRILNNATIYIKNDRIMDITINDDNKEKTSNYDDDVIDARGMVVLPGLVNSHVHTVQTLFRGVTDNLRLIPWLQKYIYPMEGVMNAEEVYTSSLMGYAEMIRAGTTTCADMQSIRYVDTAFEAASKIGIRATIAKSMMDSEIIPNNLREDTSSSIKESQRLVKQWDKKDNGRLRSMYGPRFIQGCSTKLLKEAAEIASLEGNGIHTHAAENLDEVKNNIQRYKKRSIEILDDFGLIGSRSILAHCIHINEREFDIISKKSSNVVHCPSSNLKLASGICQVPSFLKRKINIAIGVDGAACNNNLDIFKDMRLAALLSKISRGSKNFAVSAMDILEMATKSGAKALGLDDTIGSIEIGKKADLTIVSLRNLETIPIFSISDQLVYATDGHNVETVIIDGKVVLKNRQLTQVNEENLILDAQLKAEQIAEKSGIDRKIVNVN